MWWGLIFSASEISCAGADLPTDIGSALFPRYLRNREEILSVTARAALSRELDRGVFRVVVWPLTNQPREKLRADLEELKRGVLDWAGAKREAQTWWNALEEQNWEQPIELLLLAMQLATRQVTIREFHKATLQAGSKDLDALIHFLDYWRRLGEDEKDVSF